MPKVWYLWAKFLQKVSVGQDKVKNPSWVVTHGHQVGPMTSPCCRGHIYPVAPKVLPWSRIKARCGVARCFIQLASWREQQRKGAVAVRSWLSPATTLLPRTLQPPQPQAQKPTGTSLLPLTGDKLGHKGAHQTQMYLTGYAVPWYMPRKGTFGLSAHGRCGNGMCLTLWKSLLCFSCTFHHLSLNCTPPGVFWLYLCPITLPLPSDQKV